MAVRFLPAPEERPADEREERESLAEVIEFRSKLKRPEPVTPWAAERSGATVPEVPARNRSRSSRSGSTYPAVTRAMTAAEVLAAATAKHAPVEARSADLPSRDAAEEGPTPYQAAVKLLARKAMSSGELQRGLREAGYSEIDVDEAVAECEASLYLDDAGLAVSVTQKLRDSKGASQTVIRRKLRERLLPDAAIDEAIAGLDADEEHELLAQTAADRARRLEGLDRQVAERRLLGFLARRGWTGARATQAVKDALDELGKPARSGVRFQ